MESRRDIFQAIADPTRREILSLISEGPRNLNNLAGQFDVSRQAISLHVKILRECGVVSITKSGRERHCELKIEALLEVSDWLEPFRKIWEGRFEQLDHLLDDLQSKPKEGSR